MERIGTFKNGLAVITAVTPSPLPDEILNIDGKICVKIIQQGVYADLGAVVYFSDLLVPNFNINKHSYTDGDVDLFANRLGYENYEQFIDENLKEGKYFPQIGYWSYFLIKNAE